jgi:hypothetical protein
MNRRTPHDWTTTLNTKTPPPRPFPVARTVPPWLLLALAVLLLWCAPAARADAGHDHEHDHGSATPAAGAASPRFAATSELFELVGIVSGRKLTLYLDHAADNAPVKEATLEVEVGGQRVELHGHADGEFEGTLAQALTPGTVAVTATVTTPAASDLLAGEIDVHAPDPAAPATTGRSPARLAAWVLGSLLALGLVAWLVRRLKAERRQDSGSLA